MYNDFTLSTGERVHLIGDPHLGKKFGEDQGILQHRLGERESRQAAHFADELEADVEFVVMIGDLFDNPYVPDAVIVAAARATLSAAERNSGTVYVFIAGNHDKPRNLALVGAWHAFREMTQGRFANLIILDRPAAVGRIAFFPWEWDRRADDQVADVANAVGIEHAVGHWDLSVFDGKDDHLAPVAALRAAWPDLGGIWSGHYHVSGRYGEVNCTGSMEPYAHGEGDMYVTLSLEDAMFRTDLHDKHVRVLLPQGVDLPEVDCLALTHKRLQAEQEDDDITVSVDDYDFHRIVRERIADRDPRVRGFIEERMSLRVSAAKEQR
jgi:hypothetical protein